LLRFARNDSQRIDVDFSAEIDSLSTSRNTISPITRRPSSYWRNCIEETNNFYR